MNDLLKIYIDRLKDGETEKFSGSLNPFFLEVDDRDCGFQKPIEIKGEAYLAEKTLIVHLNAEVLAKIQCIICSEMFDYLVKLKNVYITLPLEEIKGGVYDITPRLREEILLEVPHYLECREGKCPSRKEIEKFLITDEDRNKENTYHPFTDL